VGRATYVELFFVFVFEVVGMFRKREMKKKGK